MKPIRILIAILILVGLSAPISNPLQAQAKRKRLLVIGAVKGWQHDSTSQAMATLSNLGRESALWDTYIKTDTQLITKKKLPVNGKNLDYFDAVAYYTTGELDMDDEQKAAMEADVAADAAEAEASGAVDAALAAKADRRSDRIARIAPLVSLAAIYRHPFWQRIR